MDMHSKRGVSETITIRYMVLYNFADDSHYYLIELSRRDVSIYSSQ